MTLVTPHTAAITGNYAAFKWTDFGGAALRTVGPHGLFPLQLAVIHDTLEGFPFHLVRPHDLRHVIPRHGPANTITLLLLHDRLHQIPDHLLADRGIFAECAKYLPKSRREQIGAEYKLTRKFIFPLRLPETLPSSRRPVDIETFEEITQLDDAGDSLLHRHAKANTLKKLPPHYLTVELLRLPNSESMDCFEIAGRNNHFFDIPEETLENPFVRRIYGKYFKRSQWLNSHESPLPPKSVDIRKPITIDKPVGPAAFPVNLETLGQGKVGAAFVDLRKAFHRFVLELFRACRLVRNAPRPRDIAPAPQAQVQPAKSPEALPEPDDGTDVPA